jgi:hypothetical protein
MAFKISSRPLRKWRWYFKKGQFGAGGGRHQLEREPSDQIKGVRAFKVNSLPCNFRNSQVYRPRSVIGHKHVSEAERWHVSRLNMPWGRPEWHCSAKYKHTGNLWWISLGVDAAVIHSTLGL